MGTPSILHLQIDPRSGFPVYRQMMDQIKYYIASGTLKAGDQLPSIRELAQLLAVNPTTVVKAYSELQGESVIEIRHGKGAFITESAVRIPLRERDQALRRLARQLVVESKQMGAPKDLVLRVVKQQLDEIHGEDEKFKDRSEP